MKTKTEDGFPAYDSKNDLRPNPMKIDYKRKEKDRVKAKRVRKQKRHQKCV